MGTVIAIILTVLLIGFVLMLGYSTVLDIISKIREKKEKNKKGGD